MPKNLRTAQLLHDVLVGSESPSTLNRDLDGSTTIAGSKRTTVRVIDVETGDHQVTAEQLTRLCDAVHAGEVDPAKLEVIAFCLIASDYFQWDRSTSDGARVAKVLDDWSGTEIGYPLTPPNIAKARHFLATGQDTFTPDDLEAHLETE